MSTLVKRDEKYNYYKQKYYTKNGQIKYYVAKKKRGNPANRGPKKDPNGLPRNCTDHIIETIIVMIEKGISKKRIIEDLGITYYKLNKILGYINKLNNGNEPIEEIENYPVD